MYVFSRRAIQRMLDALVDVASDTQLRGLAERLNRPGPDRLAATWEIAVLFSLSRVGAVQYEPAMPDGKTPDAVFTVSDGGFPTLVLDVTSVSDSGLHELNPVDHFSKELARLARRYGLNPNKLQYRVGRIKDSDRPKRVLALPTNKHELSRLVMHHVAPFLKDVRDRQLPHHTVQIAEGDIEFVVSYNYDQTYMSGNYASYTAVNSPTRNALHDRLREKAEKLKSTPDGFVRGIVACNAGCSAFTRQSAMGRNVSSKDIAASVLRQYSSLGFIFLINAQHPNQHSWNPLETSRVILEWELSVSPGSLDASHLEDILDRAIREMPPPLTDAVNSMHRAREASYGFGYLGRNSRGASMIKISSRGLADLIAGRVSPEEFRRAHGWRTTGDQSPAGSILNPFEVMLASGRTITDSKIEKTDGDDDWITFRFGGVDPAISPFTAPTRTKS